MHQIFGARELNTGLGFYRKIKEEAESIYWCIALMRGRFLRITKFVQNRKPSSIFILEG